MEDAENEMKMDEDIQDTAGLEEEVLSDDEEITYDKYRPPP
jgi:hypothetical protein